MMVPASFLIQYCEIKEQICAHVFANYPKPKNYEFLVEVQKLILDIRHQTLNLSTSKINKLKFEARTRPFMKKVLGSNNYIDYNPWIVKTGRLSTNPTSFPALTFDKRCRSILEPKNDAFMEFDYNAAELRIFLALLGKIRPEGDMYEWLGSKIGVDDRAETKSIVLPWFYSPEKEHAALDTVFSRDDLTRNYWDGNTVHTIFEREIPNVDRHHALNYIVQSTAADIVLEQACELRQLLKGRKSFITMLMHDSVIIDLAKEDRNLLTGLKSSFEATRLGTIKTNVSMGKDFGQMEKLNI